VDRAQIEDEMEVLLSRIARRNHQIRAARAAAQERQKLRDELRRLARSYEEAEEEEQEEEIGWSGTGLLCKGDGEAAVECDRETGEIREVECDPCSCVWLQKKHCRPVGTLQFLLYRVPGVGVWQIDTSSYHSIVNINSAVDFIKGLTGGRIAMIPLKLVVRPKEVTVEGRKKVIYVLDLASEHLRLEDILKAARHTVEVPHAQGHQRPGVLRLSARSAPTASSF